MRSQVLYWAAQVYELNKHISLPRLSFISCKFCVTGATSVVPYGCMQATQAAHLSCLSCGYAPCLQSLWHTWPHKPATCIHDYMLAHNQLNNILTNIRLFTHLVFLSCETLLCLFLLSPILCSSNPVQHSMTALSLFLLAMQFLLYRDALSQHA